MTVATEVERILHKMPDNQLEKTPLRYMPQLDGLRAFAVFGVWIWHWGFSQTVAARWLPSGPLGVRLFFVLSGFLISGILLNVKRNVDAGDEGIWFAARRFYLRRALRIFPIYYLTLFVVIPLIRQIRPEAVYDLTYTSNFFFARHGSLDTTDAYLWTLSVEEQFYVVWPWIMLCIPRKFLISVMLTTLAIGPMFRAALFLALRHPMAAYVLPFGSVDAFALGGLLALLSETPRDDIARLWLCRGSLAIGLPSAIAMAWMFPEALDRGWYTVVYPLATAAVFTWVIGGAARGFSGIAGRVLQNKLLLYLGKISYGLYLYHGFVGWGLEHVFQSLHREPPSVWVYFVLRAAVTIGIATASWRFIEKPISNLKNMFTYAPNPASEPSAAVVGN